MPEEIWMNDIECPLCDRDTYCESWEIKVDPYKRQTTEITCSECGGRFSVITEISVSVVGASPASPVQEIVGYVGDIDE